MASSPAKRTFLAIDMGASSGRHLAGRFDGNTLQLEELYRFENAGVPLAGSIYWDVLAQWNHIRQGLRAAKQTAGDQITSVGIDTWGVDFGLLGRGDLLLGNPVHYRDPRTDGLLEQAFEVVPRETLFEHTGLQFMQFNTLYQLWAMRRANSPLLEAADTMLMMPDLFHWMLTGEKANELTNASTTQFLNPRTGAWATELFDRFELPRHILGRLVPPGTSLGKLRPQVAAETGLSNVNVVVPGTHDTASAVMAVPASGAPSERPNWCYISSGTWSLMGAEVASPVINDRCLALNFTNEGGVGGTTRLLKNIAGLWLVQECRRVWNEAGLALSWEDLNRLSAAARPLVSLVDPDDPSFMAPVDMPEAIRAFCRRTNQPVPADEGAVIRCALDSLALRYRLVFGWLEQLIGGRIETIHVVGGGSQNRQLCQATADACGRTVLAGPVEATAIGNVLVQAIAAGDLASIAEARDVVRRSFPVECYQPRDTAAWDEAFNRFGQLVRG